MRFAALLSALLLAAAASAQDGDFVRVDVHVTAVQGSTVVIDRGSDAGLAVNDRVTFPIAGGVQVEGLVRSVTKPSARVELVAGVLAIGAAGEAWIPKARAQAAGTPEHPPWGLAQEDWDRDLPLLAPYQAAESAGIPSVWSGYAAVGFDGTFDFGSDERQYLLGRAGLVLDGENLTPGGGAFHLDVEWYYQGANLEFDDDSESGLQIDTLSWEWGGTRNESTHVEIGRFVQNELPQLGLLDGVEVVQRTDGGDRFGFSLGFMPVLEPGLWNEDDSQGAVFYRWVAGAEEQFSLAAGFQQTLHDGELDRDLAVLDLSWIPDEQWFLWSSAWIDVYGIGDDVRSGVELTQFFLNSSYRATSRTRVGVYANYYRWPELERDELPDLPPNDMLDRKVTRLGVNGWTGLGEDLDLGARIDYWIDQNDEGIGGELDLDGSGPFDSARWSLAAFAMDGAFTTVYGGRASLSGTTSRGSWNLNYSLSLDDNEGFSGSQGELWQNQISGSWSFAFGDHWYLSLFAGEIFGDEIDALNVGFDLQRSF